MNREEKWFTDYISALTKNDINKAKEVILKVVPKNTMIYKYCRGLNRDIKNMQDRKQWMSNVFFFNDPYDSAIMVDCGLKSSYSKDETNKALEDITRQQERDREAEALRNTIFAACFSETNNSFPMWGYYAAEHKGICIGYSLIELVEKFNCFPVIYQNELILNSEEDKNLLLLAMTKSIEWNHEREWRIINIDNKFKGKPGKLISDFAEPKEIFIGCKQNLTEADNRNMNNCDWDTRYADFSYITNYAEENYIDLYYPIISRREYKLIDRAIIFNK